MADLPPAPHDEETRNACCNACGSLWHATADHDRAVATLAAGPADAPVMALQQATGGGAWPLGYDPAEADRLIGREPSL